jgi:hypothetical protein
MLWELPRPGGVTQWNSNVEDVGDIDGDGRDDIAVWATLTGNMGAVYLDSPAKKAYLGSITGESAGDLFGRSVLALGDVNGDGLGDFCIGAPSADLSSTDAGALYVFASVPEPSTLVMLLTLAIGGLLWWRRRSWLAKLSKNIDPRRSARVFVWWFFGRRASGELRSHAEHGN